MSHAHDNTLLASLGFADPDKRNRRHDMACQFLAGRETALLLAKRFCKSPSVEHDITVFCGFAEVPMSRGGGWRAYDASVVGFVDAVFYAGLVDKHSGEEADGATPVGFEVKIKPVPVGDVIRQIALYRSLWLRVSGHARHPPAIWVLATDYDLSAGDLAALSHAQIRHLRLGPRFEAFVKEYDAQTLANPTTETVVF